MSISLVVTIIVIAVLFLFLLLGAYRGFLRIILTTFSLVITLVLAGALFKPISNYIENKTVIGPRVEHRLEEYVNSALDGVTGTVQNAETAFIEALPLPSSMKAELAAKNTLAGYADQGVTSFSEYIARNLSSLVIRILTYVLLFILIFLILRLILRLSNLINHIPVLGGINRLFGAIFGVAEGVLFLWIACMIIMMMSGTDFGVTCEKVIRGSQVLTFIYEHNYLAQIVNSVVGIFKL